MTVDSYTFGRITIDGQVYSRDVLILPGQVVHSPWWRREGHSLALEDLAPVLAEHPAMLVIGTGYYGNMEVPEATLQRLREQGIELRTARTQEAVAELNRLQEQATKVAAALHLTC